MSVKKKIAVYGAYGHTGKFVARELQERNLDAILAGRDADNIESLAAEFPQFERRTAGIENPEALDKALAGADAVINCAGPFAETSEALIKAAMRAKIPYLDVAAEIEVAAAAFKDWPAKALENKTLVVPSVAFYGGLRRFIGDGGDGGLASGG